MTALRNHTMKKFIISIASIMRTTTLAGQPACAAAVNACAGGPVRLSHTKPRHALATLFGPQGRERTITFDTGTGVPTVMMRGPGGWA